MDFNLLMRIKTPEELTMTTVMTSTTTTTTTVAATEMSATVDTELATSPLTSYLQSSGGSADEKDSPTSRSIEIVSVPEQTILLEEECAENLKAKSFAAYLQVAKPTVHRQVIMPVYSYVEPLQEPLQESLQKPLQQPLQEFLQEPLLKSVHDESLLLLFENYEHLKECERHVCQICQKSGENLQILCECTDNRKLVHLGCMTNIRKGYCEICHYIFELRMMKKPMSQLWKNKQMRNLIATFIILCIWLIIWIENSMTFYNKYLYKIESYIYIYSFIILVVVGGIRGFIIIIRSLLAYAHKWIRSINYLDLKKYKAELL